MGKGEVWNEIFPPLQVGNDDAMEALEEKGEEGLHDYIMSKMWFPEYR